MPQLQNEETFIKKLQEHNLLDKIEILGPYVNRRAKITIKCKKCGKTKTLRTDILFDERFNPCVTCKPPPKTKTNKENNIVKTEEYNKKLEEIGSSVRIIEDCFTSVDPAKCKCLICGHTYSTEPRTPLNGYKCPNCNIIKQRSVNEIKNDFDVNYKLYKNICRKIQRYNIHSFSLFDMSDIDKYEYHIDHIYSLRNCFDNNIEFHIASSPINLQKLWWKDNIKKHNVSGMTQEELIEKYEKWVKSIGGEDKYLLTLNMTYGEYNFIKH
jgi:hypothetical protein